jgi:tRNA (cmo5U34)-methyltransferase
VDNPTQEQKKDRLFAGRIVPVQFVFDERVADVFEDMINRSVPGYATIISMIAVLARQYCQPGSRIYDLGCSLGAASLAMGSQVTHSDCRIVAVDNSEAMIQRLRQRLEADSRTGVPIETLCADILSLDMSKASVVVLNFTLQFIPVHQREALLRRIHQAMLPGGILILSEKILFPDPEMNQLFIDMYHRFKEEMGYSKLEIAQKRSALENVLIPETIPTHRERALAAGFRSFDVWFQCFNFASMVAFK